MNIARQGPRGGEEEGYRGGQDGRPASPEASRRGYYHGWDMYGYVSEVRTVSSGTGKQLVQLGSCAYLPRVSRQQRNLQLISQRKIPGTKRIDHKRAVKMYERAAGDKTLPSDLRPPPVLKVRSRI
jgi:SAC3/GANP family